MEEVAKYESGKPGEKAEIEKKEIQKIEIQDQITALIPLAGTIELTKEQMDILYAPVKEEDVEIRPDGLIYLPWMEYATRLRLAFGPPVMIPYGPPKKLGNFIHWGFWLIIKGRPYGFAVGEQQYFENDRMTYGDALEGAKSNALMRICKGLGISLELWKPSFVKEWKAKFAETYEERGKTKWRKKDSPEIPEKGNGNQSEEGKTKSITCPKNQMDINPSECANCDQITSCTAMGKAEEPAKEPKPGTTETKANGSFTICRKVGKEPEYKVYTKYCQTTCKERKTCTVAQGLK